MDAINPFVLTDKECALDRPIASIGGKAFHLAKLQRHGMPVPPWFVVTTAAFDAALSQLPERHLLGELDAAICAGNSPDAYRLAQSLSHALLAAPLPPETGSLLEAAHRARIASEQFVAVRSSATEEDSAGASFAGIHESYLFIRGLEKIGEMVRAVWASTFTDRAVAYRLEKRMPFGDRGIAVVVQQMVESKVSGVMFTVHPITGCVEQLLISALFGLGEGLVSAGLQADSFTIDKSSRAVVPDVVEKTAEIVFDEVRGTGTIERALAPELHSAPALSERQLKELADAGLRLETAMRRPQDIEFAFDKSDRLFLLQTRPITTAHELGPAAGHRLIWDNSNIIESYSGVTSPLTFSFIKRAYTIVYNCFAEVMGVSKPVIQANQTTFSNMLGLFRGQVYYNLLNWYRLVELFPGFAHNRRFMESMMGVKQSLDEKTVDAPGWSLARLQSFGAIGVLLIRSTFNFLRIKSLVRQFDQNFSSNYTRWGKLDFDQTAPHELMAVYYEMEERLLWNWKAPIINDFFVMIFYGLLKKLCSAWCGDTSGSLQNDLLSGEGGIESTEPTKMLLRLATLIDGDGELKQLFLSASPETLSVELPRSGKFPAFQALFNEYLQRYGFRCMNELKLEEFSLKDRPAIVYQHLKNYLGLPPEARDSVAIERREREVRVRAETAAYTKLEALPWPKLKRWCFDRVMRCARLGVKNRENMRFARTKIYGRLRELFRAMGKHFTAEGLLSDPQDVFYLAVEEIWDFVRGTAITTDLAALVALRKREFTEFREDEARVPDDRFITYGMSYHRNAFRSNAPAAVNDGPEGELRGVGCCAGVIAGPVKVIRNPTDDASLSGEILVAARTDPGWVPFYPAVSGVLIERGSILSHSAIVAREMGIPTIVGIPDLLEQLKTGDVVTMDGAKGTVVKSAKSGAANA